MADAAWERGSEPEILECAEAFRLSGTWAKRRPFEKDPCVNPDGEDDLGRAAGTFLLSLITAKKDTA